MNSTQLILDTKDFLNIMMGDENRVMIVLNIMKGDQDRVVQLEENWTWGWKQGNLKHRKWGMKTFSLLLGLGLAKYIYIPSPTNTQMNLVRLLLFANWAIRAVVKDPTSFEGGYFILLWAKQTNKNLHIVLCALKSWFT